MERMLVHDCCYAYSFSHNNDAIKEYKGKLYHRPAYDRYIPEKTWFCADFGRDIFCASEEGVIHNNIIWLKEKNLQKAASLFLENERESICDLERKIKWHRKRCLYLYQLKQTIGIELEKQKDNVFMKVKEVVNRVIEMETWDDITENVIVSDDLTIQIVGLVAGGSSVCCIELYAIKNGLAIDSMTNGIDTYNRLDNDIRYLLDCWM